MTGFCGFSRKRIEPLFHEGFFVPTTQIVRLAKMAREGCWSASCAAF